MRSSSIGRQKQRQAKQRDHLGQNENRSIAVAGMPPQTSPEALGNKDRHNTPQEKRGGATSAASSATASNVGSASQSGLALSR